MVLFTFSCIMSSPSDDGQYTDSDKEEVASKEGKSDIGTKNFLLNIFLTLIYNSFSFFFSLFKMPNEVSKDRQFFLNNFFLYSSTALILLKVLKFIKSFHKKKEKKTELLGLVCLI